MKRLNQVRRTESWVIYKAVVAGEVAGPAGVCEQDEWEAMERAEPGGTFVVQSGVADEGVGERLAWGADGGPVLRVWREGGEVTELIETCQRCGGLRVARVLARCSDMCAVDVAGRHQSGYVPRDLGVGGGDDAHFAYCLDCGQIQGRLPLPPAGIEEGRDSTSG